MMKKGVGEARSEKHGGQCVSARVCKSWDACLKATKLGIFHEISVWLFCYIGYAADFLNGSLLCLAMSILLAVLDSLLFCKILSLLSFPFRVNLSAVVALMRGEVFAPLPLLLGTGTSDVVGSCRLVDRGFRVQMEDVRDLRARENGNVFLVD